MKLVLEGCNHRAVEAISVPDEGPMVATCLTCYKRLTASGDHLRGSRRDIPWFPAVPPAPCPHNWKKPVQEGLTRSRGYHDAVCTDCGKVLRHTDGVGAWEDVLFYDYLIQERTW